MTKITPVLGAARKARGNGAMGLEWGEFSECGMPPNYSLGGAVEKQVCCLEFQLAS
jgi:hypothetical protein